MSEWTEVRIEFLRKRWGQGATASTIAREMGGVTRNAVIGKASRLGLTGRPSPIKSRDPASTAEKRKGALRQPHRRNRDLDGARALFEARERSAQPLRLSTPVLIKPEPKPLLIDPASLTRDACAWPIGDPKAPDFKFCGAKPVELGKPYCSHHCAKAYRSPDEPASQPAGREAA